jgi:hypothetical protein
VGASPFRLWFDVKGTLATSAKECETDVFGASFGDTPETLAEAYGPYEAASVFLAVTDRQDDVVGVVRLIQPNPRGLKTIVDLAGPPWHLDGARSAHAAGIDLARTWDMATLGVRRELGGRGEVVAAALYHGVIAGTRANGIEWVIAIVDLAVRSRLASLGLTPHALPGASVGRYLGSVASLPTFRHIPTMVDEQRRLHPDNFRLIALGTGLDGVAIPAPEAFVLGRQLDLTGVPETVGDRSLAHPQ